MTAAIVLILIAIILGAALALGQLPAMGLRLGVLSVFTLFAWGAGRIATSLPLAPALYLIGALGLTVGAVAMAVWAGQPLWWGFDGWLDRRDGVVEPDEEDDPTP